MQSFLLCCSHSSGADFAYENTELQRRQPGTTNSESKLECALICDCLQVDEEMAVLLQNLKDMVEAEKAAKLGKKGKKKKGKKKKKVRECVELIEHRLN